MCLFFINKKTSRVSIFALKIFFWRLYNVSFHFIFVFQGMSWEAWGELQAQTLSKACNLCTSSIWWLLEITKSMYCLFSALKSTRVCLLILKIHSAFIWELAYVYAFTAESLHWISLLGIECFAPWHSFFGFFWIGYFDFDNNNY